MATKSPTPIASNQRATKRNRYDHEILLLQGGGALGSYHAGVYEALAEAGMMPTWVVGISIGAINAAIIAGNPPERRIARLREFWNRSSVHAALPALPMPDSARSMLDRLSVLSVVMFGVPGFFVPRLPFSLLAPTVSPGELSFYDTSPLERTLEELVDFEFLNSNGMRLSLGAVNVQTGESKYFDSRHTRITPKHVMASGALPPAFPGVEIDGEFYWDGGLVSNTPLTYVWDQKPLTTALLVQVNLFPSQGQKPEDMLQVMERIKDIQYCSKQRFSTEYHREIGKLRGSIRRLLAKIPPHLRDDPDVRRIEAHSAVRKWTIALLTDTYQSNVGQWKDADFSRATVNERWARGVKAVHRSLADREWTIPSTEVPGIRIYDLPPATPREKSNSAEKNRGGKPKRLIRSFRSPRRKRALHHVALS